MVDADESQVSNLISGLDPLETGGLTRSGLSRITECPLVGYWNLAEILTLWLG